MAKTQTTLTQSVIPEWYTNYAQQTLANQQAVANKPFTPYTGDRVAGINDTEKQAKELALDATTNYQGTLQQALQGTNAAGGRSTTGAAQPWIDRASDSSGLATANNSLDLASGLTAASTNALGINMAQPYLDMAGQKATDTVTDYMNPYIDNVINRYGELGARTLREKLLPEIGDRYVSAGQDGYGPASTGMTTESLRALRDVNDSVQSQMLTAMSEGYDKAMGYAQTDAARMGQVASTAGSLGAQQQGALASAASNMASIGGQQANITQSQQQLLASLAGQIAQNYGQDTANQLAQSGQLAQLAQQMQAQQLAGSQALAGIGATERGVDQARADAAYQEFMREQNYDQEQIDAMARTMAGVAPGVPNAQVSITSSKKPSTSTMSTLAGLAATYAGSAGNSAAK